MSKSRLPDDSVDFLALLSEENRRRVLERSTRNVYPAGTLVYRAGDPPRALLIERGLVRVFRSIPDGRQATVAFLHSDGLLGGVGIVSELPMASAQFVVKSIVTDLDLKTIRSLAASEIQVVTAVAAQLAVLVRNAQRLVALRTLGNIRERLAYDLLERACQCQLEMGRLDAKVTQTDLAASIGTSREVVSRSVKGLRTAGILRTAPGVIHVVDPVRLAETVRAFVAA
jgi:CRP/FNR family cyclic AMP-dependent transcriptional regulator